jgi:hypothetical protein
VLYGIEVLEQFKGELPPKTAFVTHQILFPERPLRVDEKALVLLRDLAIRQSLDRPIQDELDFASQAIAKCGPVETTLYVAIFEENVFPLVSEAAPTRGQTPWIEYRRESSMPPDLQPRRKGKCEALRAGGCIVTEHPSVGWSSVRSVLKSWASR